MHPVGGIDGDAGMLAHLGWLVRDLVLPGRTVIVGMVKMVLTIGDMGVSIRIDGNGSGCKRTELPGRINILKAPGICPNLDM